jgi:hypothetical protein
MKLIKMTFCACLAAVALSGALFAEPPDTVTIAVFDFSSNAGTVLPKDVTALVLANLSAQPHIAMVERAQLKKALAEQAFGRSGNIDLDAAAKVGQLTGAKVLIQGRAIRLKEILLIVANIIGAETGRVYSEKVQGASTNLMDLTESLSQKIAQTITAQSSNLLGGAQYSRERLIETIVEKTKGRKLPSVSITIKETIAGESGEHSTAQNEFGMIFQKAGFEIITDKSQHRPDVVVTGTAVVDGGKKNNDLFSYRAIIEILAEDGKTGKMLAIDHEQTPASDLGKQTAARAALERAADALAARIVPALAE